MRILLVLLLALPGWAQSATVFKCVGGDGHTTFSDRPCGVQGEETRMFEPKATNELPSAKQIEQLLGSTSQSVYEVRGPNISDAPAPSGDLMPDNEPPPGIKYGDPSGIRRNPAGL